MKLNKKDKNYLLSTLFRGYVIQCAACSVLTFGSTFLLGIMAEEFLRRYVLHYYLYYRTVYLYIVAVIMWGVCIIVLTYRLLKKVVAYVYELQAATGKLFDQTVSYIELSPELGEIAANINQLKQEAEGNARLAKENEQRKNDLVVYLAHDLKTPLTSIISYVELLKQEEGLPEHVKEYILILENKSQRLKSMVQDVFEVSKAASGNLPVNLEELDLGKLLRQTIADMGEQIENSSVRLKTEIPENAVMICADGERVYRVFQNLIQNALRYSLEGSRVYVTLREDGRTAIASVKNTSREELPAGMDFTERFTRGDESRSDGGSGLGLSIARSFTEACGGSFKVETIADLFVVTVIFPERREEGGMSFIQKD